MKTTALYHLLRNMLMSWNEDVTRVVMSSGAHSSCSMLTTDNCAHIYYTEDIQYTVQYFCPITAVSPQFGLNSSKASL